MRKSRYRSETFKPGGWGRCWHCRLPTRYVDFEFEAPLHPGRCTRAKDAEYWKAVAS